jgi:hypothetical protein
MAWTTSLPLSISGWALAAALPQTGGKLVVPLPDGVQCFIIAATIGKRAGDLRDRLIGDSIAPLESALGHHPKRRLALTLPESRQWIGYGMNHLDLLNRRADYARIREWMAAPG